MRKGWMDAERSIQMKTWMGGDALNSVRLPAIKRSPAMQRERPIYWPVVNELNPLEGVRCWYYYDYTRRAESYGVSCVYMRRNATCEQSLAELISLARKMAHTEARNLWLKTLPLLLPVYLAWPFIAIAAVTDTYGLASDSLGSLCRVRLMCAHISTPRALFQHCCIFLLWQPKIPSPFDIGTLRNHFSANMSRIYSFAWTYALSRNIPEAFVRLHRQF